MSKSTDIRLIGAELYFLPVETMVPLKFGAETLTSVTCARARVVVEDRQGRRAAGWGETPLSVQWAWPSAAAYQPRHQAMKDFCIRLTEVWATFSGFGHPIEIGFDFQRQQLPALQDEVNRQQTPEQQIPLLASLVCCSLFDIAVHDAYGNLHGVPVYTTYNDQFMNRDLGQFLESADDLPFDFNGKYPNEFLSDNPKVKLPVWHLVGGLDPVHESSDTGSTPIQDQPHAPRSLGQWIEQDGLNCLKIKLRGNDADWDYKRLVDVGEVADAFGKYFLSADFNCTVVEPEYVNQILDRLQAEHPKIFESILYVEQPFPHDLKANQIEVSSVTDRKPLLMDESAHSWEYVRLGRSLGWSGVALKTCKTQTGALLSLCWAKAYSMQVMVQDLTNPMLAQIPHVLLAAHSDTLRGVESNAMQFYPQASTKEAAVHPGLYSRRNGELDLTTISGSGFGYRLDQIQRQLGNPVVTAGDTVSTQIP